MSIFLDAYFALRASWHNLIRYSVLLNLPLLIISIKFILGNQFHQLLVRWFDEDLLFHFIGNMDITLLLMFLYIIPQAHIKLYMGIMHNQVENSQYDHKQDKILGKLFLIIRYYINYIISYIMSFFLFFSLVTIFFIFSVILGGIFITLFLHIGSYTLIYFLTGMFGLITIMMVFQLSFFTQIFLPIMIGKGEASAVFKSIGYTFQKFPAVFRMILLESTFKTFLIALFFIVIILASHFEIQTQLPPSSFWDLLGYISNFFTVQVRIYLGLVMFILGVFNIFWDTYKAHYIVQLYKDNLST